MKRENIEAAADRAGLIGRTREVFVEFFAKGFPDESDAITSYVDEWAERFATGHPMRYMDTIRQKIFEGIITSNSIR